MNNKKWVCWTLSIEDIKDVCETEDINFNDLTEEQIENIAYNFQKSIETACEMWGTYLSDCIEDSLTIKQKVARKI